MFIKRTDKCKMSAYSKISTDVSACLHASDGGEVNSEHGEYIMMFTLAEAEIWHPVFFALFHYKYNHKFYQCTLNRRSYTYTYL